MRSRLFCLSALVVGTFTLLFGGGEPPSWLLKLEVLLFSMAALLFGYTTFTPSAPTWVWSKPVRGVSCIYLGVGAMFVPPQFIVSAVFLGIGTRLCMQSVTEVAVRVSAPFRGKRDIVLRESGGITKG